MGYGVMSWTWQEEVPPPVELPDGLVWRWDPDSDDWNVLDSFDVLVGYVYYRRSCEDYGHDIVCDEPHYRRSCGSWHRAFRVGSPSEYPLDACRALAVALRALQEA